MSLDRHFVRSVELSTIRTRYPRSVGRNARLGSHGSGGVSEIVIIRTNTGKVGFGRHSPSEAPPLTAEVGAGLVCGVRPGC